LADNRRSSSRHDVDVPCTFSDGVLPGVTETRITNMSVGGAFVAYSRLPMGHRVHVSFRVPTQESTISIGAVVRWATDQGIGVQFDGLRPKDVWALSKYFDTL
jgi:hypothetical protein